MRGAVEKSYKASWAAACIADVPAGEYALQRAQDGSIVDGGGMVLDTADDHNLRGRSGMGDDVPHETLVLHGRWWAGRARHHPPSQQRQRQEHECE